MYFSFNLLKRFSQIATDFYNMGDSLVLGIDIGGSHITAGWVDLDSRVVLEHTVKRRKVNSGDQDENIIVEWAAVIHDVAGMNPDTRIGMALPGPFDYENGISYIKGLEKYESLYGKNVKTLLADALRLPTENIRMKNDAGCFLQGEIFAGSAQGFNSCIGLTIGTGIGTAKAKNGIAEDADLWKTPMKGDICENYLSTRWFVKRYAQKTGEQVKDVKHLCDLLADEPSLQSIFDEFSENLTEFLTFFIREENPEIIIIGGNISNASALFLPKVKAGLAASGLNIPIKKSDLGEHAVLLGSASLWSNQLQPAK
jgi:glucokinase